MNPERSCLIIRECIGGIKIILVERFDSIQDTAGMLPGDVIVQGDVFISAIKKGDE